MENQHILVLSIGIGLFVFLFVKFFLYRIVKFKMDESAILHFMNGPAGKDDCFTPEQISAGTKMEPGRVLAVCVKSRVIVENSAGSGTWRPGDIGL